jgi:hypothetical protein
LGDEGYEHLKVNHSITVKDAETGACTNTIESSWRHAKVVMPQYHRKKDFFPSHLAKYIFMKRCRTLDLDPPLTFFEQPVKFTTRLAMKKRRSWKTMKLRVKKQRIMTSIDILFGCVFVIIFE